MGAALVALLALASTALARWAEAAGRELRYTSLRGYFVQDEPSTDPSGFDYAATNFGLVDRAYPIDGPRDGGPETQWPRLARWVDYLNANCADSGRTRYKVLVMGRHGQGWHNVAESFYGTPAWNCYWAELDGNGTAAWADALLTPQGLAEARRAGAYYGGRVRDHGMPAFDSYYSSPLRRCIQTANGTFTDVDLPPGRPFAATIKELLREDMSIHTCDRRSTRSELRAFAPASFDFERGFAEADELWQGGPGRSRGETHAHQLARSKVLLDDVFASDDGSWLSLTSHSGEIAALLEVLGHRPFGLGTGQLIPVLVRAEAAEGGGEGGAPAPAPTEPGFTFEATCTAPPVTSLADEGCVCSTAAAAAATATASPMQAAAMATP